MWLTCRWQCIYQAAVFPSLTDSTVVSATPATSPPHQTKGCEDFIVLRSTTGRFPCPSFNGDKACITKKQSIDFWKIVTKTKLSYLVPFSSQSPEPNAEITVFALSVVSCCSSSTHFPSSVCSVRLKVTETIFPFSMLTLWGDRKPNSSHFSCIARETYES